MSLSYCHHLEHRAERTENVGSCVRPEGVAKAVACEDSLNNIGGRPLIIGSSADTSKSTAAS